jgi:23S rRNA (adenine2503-C2)-methyltransferase
LLRNLSSAEILEQVMVVRAAAALRDQQLRNVVFMGMGEPLHNWPNVREAIRFLLRDDGFYFSPSHVCVSTAGVIAPLLQCAREFPKLRIAISLHSCDHDIRSQIVPRGVGSLEQIRNAIVQINHEFPDRTIWLELVMLKDQTDRDQDIDLLLEFVRDLNIEINLIPYNVAASVQGHLRSQRSDRTWEIAQRLRGAGIFTTIRYSGGQNIAAACGQLSASLSRLQSAH